ncbi:MULTISPECIES: phosphatase PAP2/dual specificity phosphatase family protein [unclassified Acinetobacter]|uniref:phosphatase PAP2/dual specificity phosphatase family protein n=1 Tax=unclassified Acinetobacter TaxID=196816 RepID=UPI0018ABC14A|nr:MULTISPECIES: phosphatase PAP2/dual specificity phosphatase family protein [unclassified Acinetobacter]MBJ9951531.1 phosphatase PAP2/dual specificity phosphatase family protein [Acinetobacter baumannii]
MPTLIKESGTWKWGLLCLVLFAPFFFLTYGFANQYASALTDVPSIVFDWEKNIPLWPWTIVPYWSIDLFYGLSLLLCWNKFELKQQALRLFLAQVISISCFLLFPLKFSFERPALDGFFGLWFDVLMGFDKPFNQAPSLHIVLMVILWDFYRRHVQGSWKYLVDFWSALIGLSILTTWQHHFIDLPTGILVGALCLWLFPITVKSPFRKDGLQQLTAKHLKLGSYYLCGAVIFLILAYELRPWGLWLIYPAVSLFIVAHSYSFVRPHFFQKQTNGKMTVAAQILLAPYLIFAWLNSRIWTKKHPEDSLVIDSENRKIFIGRIPTQKDSQKYTAIFDCVAELPLNSESEYQQYPSLDLIPLQANQLDYAVNRFNQLLINIDHSPSQNILVCCALGYSRSSALLAAWLMQQNQDATVEDVIEIIRKARPWVVLKAVQIEELQIYQLKLKGLAP